MTESEAQPRPADASTAQLVAQLTEKSSQLIRDELRLAQAEMTAKARHAGVGAGLFGGAGLVALYGVGSLIATVILLLALVMSPWLAALIVTLVLFVIAGIAALVGKRHVSEATPPKPEQTIASVQQDVQVVKKGSQA